MGKAVLAEEVLLNYLTALAKGSVGFIPGLIVGQVSEISRNTVDHCIFLALILFGNIFMNMMVSKARLMIFFVRKSTSVRIASD